jgi:hypothetical protein
MCYVKKMGPINGEKSQTPFRTFGSFGNKSALKGGKN